MKKNILLFSCIALLAASPCSAGMLESLWNKYIPTEDGRPLSPPPSPVDIQKKNSVELLGTFTHNWKYQSTTHELFYEDHRALARSIYGLAIYAGDVDSSLDPQKFIEGVLGYHYRVTQVCAWLNAVVSKKTSSPELDEENLIGVLLSDGVIAIKGGNFVPTGKYSHILAASQGKKRPFSDNLRHERLHVFWDEDSVFRERAQQEWKTLSEEERQKIRKTLHQYAQENEAQLLEEWAVKRAETSRMSIE